MPMIQLWERFTLISNKSLKKVAVFCSNYKHFPFKIRDRQKETDRNVNLSVFPSVIWEWPYGGSEDTA